MVAQKKWLNPILVSGAWIYKMICRFHRWLYRSGIRKAFRPEATVISVGNVTVGGTGKTPLVIMIARNLVLAGKKVAVLTRGYGNDEIHELTERLDGVPVLGGKNRALLSRTAVEKHQAEVLILDDGFQHWALQRDLDIVTINCTNPFGNGRLLPAGPLREAEDNLARGGCFVLSKAFQGRQNTVWLRQKLAKLNASAPIFEADHQPICFVDYRKDRHLPLGMVRQERVAVLSAIEDPASFENTLSRLGANVVYAARFRDHHEFTRAEMDEVFRGCQEAHARYLVTTAKDGYRLRKILDPQHRLPTRILILQIEVRIDDEEGLVRKCLDVCRLRSVSKTA
ncbi:MAG: tetraacyldisaccharide 4'-kinase [Candidatus Omnitrophica bacterium]|nr:tetraacyldisaccharide 4'-kinase [Candidatus Omnitrophota bacterium]